MEGANYIVKYGIPNQKHSFPTHQQKNAVKKAEKNGLTNPVKRDARRANIYVLTAHKHGAVHQVVGVNLNNVA